MEADVPVYQGDTIMVPKAGTIYVVGEVLQPSAFLMENKSGYTALRALAMAHGPTRLAKLSQAVIVRQTPAGVEQIPAPLDKIAQSKAPDVELVADDILMVPTNHAKNAAIQAFAMAQSIAILGVTRVWQIASDRAPSAPNLSLDTADRGLRIRFCLTPLRLRPLFVLWIDFPSDMAPKPVLFTGCVIRHTAFNPTSSAPERLMPYARLSELLE